MTHANLLLVEDEENIGATLSDLLTKAEYQVTWAHTQAEALAAIAALPFDIALLDVNLPDGNGFQIAEKLQSTATAILFLTAMSDPEMRVRGLQLGAEDYVIKPFHFQELLLRIRNALKRQHYVQQKVTEKIQIGAAQVDFTAFTVLRDGQLEKLSSKEQKLLQLLYSRRGRVVSRDEILNHVWPSETFPTTRTVDNFILRLRRLVEPDPENPKIICTIRGIGYQLITDWP